MSEWELIRENEELRSNNEALRAQLASLQAQVAEAVAWVDVIDSLEGPYNFYGKELLPKGRHSLYARLPVPSAVPDEDADRRGSLAMMDPGMMSYARSLHEPQAKAQDGMTASALLDAFDAETEKVPVGEESETRGKSTYNWRRAIVREMRAMIAAAQEAK